MIRIRRQANLDSRQRRFQLEDTQSVAARRVGSKTTLLIALLKRKDSAGLDEIVTATGWQAHSP